MVNRVGDFAPYRGIVHDVSGQLQAVQNLLKKCVTIGPALFRFARHLDIDAPLSLRFRDSADSPVGRDEVVGLMGQADPRFPLSPRYLIEPGRKPVWDCD